MKTRKIRQALGEVFSPEHRQQIIKALDFSAKSYEKQGNTERAQAMREVLTHTYAWFMEIEDGEEEDEILAEERKRQLVVVNPERFSEVLIKSIIKAIDKSFRKADEEYRKEKEEQFHTAIVRVVPCIMGFDPAKDDDTEPEEKKDGKRDIPVE